jgi:hypothetical protein
VIPGMGFQSFWPERHRSSSWGFPINGVPQIARWMLDGLTGTSDNHIGW